MTTAIVHRSTYLTAAAAQRGTLARAAHLGRVAGVAASIRAAIGAGNRTLLAPHPSRPHAEPVAWDLSRPVPVGDGIVLVLAAGEPVAVYPPVSA